MPDLTPNLNLKKPLGTEIAHSNVFNENYDLIDANTAHINHRHDPAEETNGFMAAADKRKLDKIVHKVVAETGELADGDTWGALAGLISPAEILSYEPGSNTKAQKLEVGEDETVYCRLITENTTTSHTEDTVLNEPGSEWVSSLSGRNTSQIKVAVRSRKKFTANAPNYSGVTQGVTQVWLVLYRKLGAIDWKLFEEKIHLRTGKGRTRYKEEFDLTNDFTFTITLPPAQYEIKIVYVSETPYETDEEYYGLVDYENTYLTMQSWEEISDLELAAGDVNYITIGEEEI